MKNMTSTYKGYDKHRSPDAFCSGHGPRKWCLRRVPLAESWGCPAVARLPLGWADFGANVGFHCLGWFYTMAFGFLNHYYGILWMITMEWYKINSADYGIEWNWFYTIWLPMTQNIPLISAEMNLGGIKTCKNHCQSWLVYGIVLPTWSTNQLNKEKESWFVAAPLPEMHTPQFRDTRQLTKNRSCPCVLRFAQPSQWRN